MELEIPAGTQSGDDFVLRGKGVPHLRGAGRGDMIVRSTVVVPESLSDEQRELLERYAATEREKPPERRLVDKMKDLFAG